jgi:hypothetical protein
MTPVDGLRRGNDRGGRLALVVLSQAGFEHELETGERSPPITPVTSPAITGHAKGESQ